MMDNSKSEDVGGNGNIVKGAYKVLFRRFHRHGNALDEELLQQNDWKDIMANFVESSHQCISILSNLAAANSVKQPVHAKQQTTGISTTTAVAETQSQQQGASGQFQPIQIYISDQQHDDLQPSTSSSLISTNHDSFQDSKVYQRIADLRNSGLWSETRLPMCADPTRPKLHWDYFLEEVVWMASDFKAERRLKRRVARKFASSAKSFWRLKIEKKSDDELKIKREREAKRICGLIAKMIREFWNGVDKVVDYRANEIVESKKKKALDQHLKFLVGEADKISTQLHERLAAQSHSPVPSHRTKSSRGGDGDFTVSESDEDDERTILEEEKLHGHDVDVCELSKEAMLAQSEGLDDFLSSLPPGYLDKYYNELAAISTHSSAASTTRSTAIEIEDESGEQTNQSSEATTSTTTGTTTHEPTPTSSQTETTSSNNIAVDGAQSATNDASNSSSTDHRRQKLNNIAEAALEFQPTGYTLATTQVKTEVPFLLCGSLREYQLVGLDWLVTLYEKGLNGILADEMGLGKTIQTIALLAHLACDRAVWGPHLIIVPTTVILNWEMEVKKWCPSFKVITYFGSAKERAEKRKGWSKENSFHICITSYKLATQDVRVFKNKAWQYLILDEAQNIKNFKSQRWQTLLNVRSRHRLLLTGTPLQNSLMELWSLLHFLMPNVFTSHEDFRAWFSNPLSGMVEGNKEVDTELVKRLHKVLRPFILRRLKSEVEKQLPTKTEKVIKCPLSKRQRQLYSEFMARRSTRENLQSGNVLSVLGIIMQLRKCCNHPNLFEPRPIISPFTAPSIPLQLSSKFFLSSAYLSHFNDDDDNNNSGISPSSLLRFIDTSTSETAWPIFERISHGISAKSDPTALALLTEKSEQSSSSKHRPVLRGLKFSIDFHPTIDLLDFAQPPAKKSLQSIKSNSMVNGITPPNSNTLNGTSLVSNATSSNNNSKSTTTTTTRITGSRKRKFNATATASASADLIQPIKHRKQQQKQSKATEVKANSSSPSSLFQQLRAEITRKRQEKNWEIAGWLTEHARRIGRPILGDETISLLRHLNPLIEVPSVEEPFTFVPHKNAITNLDCAFQKSILDRINNEIAEGILEWVQSAIDRFVLCVNKVLLCDSTFCPLPITAQSMHQMNLNQSHSTMIYSHQSIAAHKFAILSALEFPELRLIEYDCGKLQMLSQLLVQLFENKHRCLIFTQMSRMLDILQSFLSHHNYKYFRLDGSTHIDQRQAMMERFNSDESIFCFILSTRSGGIGVNLTGADTVIFYDSDWNPTMDAQAQDRCHRIGQTKDVTIYRLISDKTIEENILLRSNQKRRLGEMALDEAEFTPEFFKDASNIRELFSNEEGVADIVRAPTTVPQSYREIEKAMANVEDTQDAVAAEKAKQEYRIELAEFDEMAPGPSSNVDCSAFKGIDAPSGQYLELISKLKPIERYAVNFLEQIYKPELEKEIEETEAMFVEKREEHRKHQRAFSELTDATLAPHAIDSQKPSGDNIELTYDVSSSIYDEVQSSCAAHKTAAC